MQPRGAAVVYALSDDCGTRLARHSSTPDVAGQERRGNRDERANPRLVHVSHRIVDEVHFPRMGQANTRDLGLIVTDRKDFFSEEKRATASRITAVACGDRTVVASLQR